MVKNYYEILGIPKTATPEQIKQQYRLLARKYHPDVADDKAAAKAMFLQIAEAYQTLISPDRRLIYDASLETHVFRSAPSRPSGPARPAGPSTSHRTSTRPTQAQSQAQTQASDAERSRAAELRRWVKEAETAFSGAQFRSAIYACKEVLRLDSRNIRAHIILGDIYRIQGSLDQAISMYTIAVQLDPKNVDVQAKLNRLFRKAKIEDKTPSERSASLRMGLSMIGLAIGASMILLLAISLAEPDGWMRMHPFIDTWSRLLVATLAVDGALVGFLLSMNEWVHRLDDELVFKTVRGAHGIGYPIGLLLLMFSVFNFYVSVVLYVIIGVIQESISKSVIVAFAAAFMLVLVITAIYSAGHMQVLYFGGNIVFPTLMIGWAIGDMCRPGF